MSRTSPLAPLMPTPAATPRLTEHAAALFRGGEQPKVEPAPEKDPPPPAGERGDRNRPPIKPARPVTYR